MKRQDSAALYMRLSVDDESYGDSVSIETQRTILQAYASENSFAVYGEYVDDGWSGTNFQRPAFQRMMADVDAGKVNCIITKDLSRFGREHVMMDYYLEFVFPAKRVRYIAVTDDEDTEKGLSDFVPFKNLFNEWLAKDTSRKVKAAYRAKFASGEHLCACAPLGYKKDPEHPNRLLIDGQTRWIVERIFALAARGTGPAKIVRILTEEKVPTPSWIHYQREGLFANIHGQDPGGKAYSWTNACVTNILTNETYIGSSVHNREHKVSYKNKKRIRSPREEWLVVEHTHEGIIDPELFGQVQKQVSVRRRSRNDRTAQIFSGLLRCGGCGRALSYGTNRGKKSSFAYYACSGYRQYGPKRAGCTQHYIRYDVLYSCVLARLREWAALAQIDESRLLQRMLDESRRERSAAARKQGAELAKAEKRRGELDRLFTRLYEDWVAGKITERNFDLLSEKYQTEQAQVEAQLGRLRAEADEGRESADSAEKWGPLIRQYAEPTALTAGMLNALIEKIVVHEAVKAPDGSREQEIEIYYRFAGRPDG